MKARKILDGLTRKFREGDRVKISYGPELRSEDPDIPEFELGTIEWDEGDDMFVVQVDKEFIGKGDDGAREVSADWLELITAGDGVFRGNQTAGTTEVRDYLSSKGKAPEQQN